jgi:two-component system, cell cycle sensor histidine kinase and response regulator CckA
MVLPGVPEPTSAAEVPAPRRQRILLVDDDRIQLKLAALRLRRSGYIVTTASNAREALALATGDPPDAILSDVVMDEVDGFDLCQKLREHVLLERTPIILLSAHYADHHGRALAAKVGASALVGRSPSFDAELRALEEVFGQERSSGTRLIAKDVAETHLRTSVHEMAKLANVAKVASDRYHALFENAADVIALLSRSGVVVEANRRWSIVLDVPLASVVGKHLLDFAPGASAALGAELDAAIAYGAGGLHALAIERPNGSVAYFDFSITVVDVGDESLVLAIGRDVTERVVSAQVLAAAEEKYRSLVEHMPDVVWSARAGVITFVSANVEVLTGFTAVEIYAADDHFWPQRVHHDDRESYGRATRIGLASVGTAAFDVEYRWRRKDDSWIWLRHRTNAVYERDRASHVDGLISDITQRKLLEESLRQSQKMEALGQLTGGIAHDFNNILAVILGNSEFLIDALGNEDPNVIDVREIKLAAERAASLTHQLLAFSRRQVLEIQVTDLNVLVVGMERFLRRLIGADIRMMVGLGDRLGKVRVDPRQIEQVVMNLAVNARDAMPGGGTLTIETSNLEVDPNSQAPQAGETPERYVVITVRDTGSGMNPQTQARIFEPFFTTKGVGTGTGLGLATSHGIVSQSGGHIEVTSEVAVGTVFKIYLPRIDAEAAELEPAPRLVASEARGSETILLAEDEPQLRATMARMLKSSGYRVLAGSAEEAVALARQHGSTIAALVTDVVMPTISGPELARLVTAVAPQVKVLFISGHTDHSLLTDGELSRARNFIQKPFSPSALVGKLRRTLDATAEPLADDGHDKAR